MQLFFSDNINDNLITLDKVESNHCLKVLRYNVGDKVHVVDGLNNYYEGIIASIENKICHVRIKKKTKAFDDRQCFVHIAISPIKNQDRLEWFIEKAVEIGVDEISFINCNRTLRKNIRLERITKIAKSAMKQTLKATLPKINPMISFSDFVKNLNSDSNFICHLEHTIKNDIFSYRSNILENKKVCILIGPEGDFSIKEVENAYDKNVKPLSLGNSRLRTETAGIVACHLSNLIMSNDG